MSLSHIKISNFRVFKDFQKFNIKPITVLTGPNNSGKSSFIKLINLLKISSSNKGRLNRLNFDKFPELGNYKGTLNSEEKDLSVGISMLYGNVNYELILHYNNKNIGKFKDNRNPYLKDVQLYYNNQQTVSIKFVSRENETKNEPVEDIFEYDINIQVFKEFLQEIEGYNSQSKNGEKTYPRIKIKLESDELTSDDFSFLENKEPKITFEFLQNHLVFLIPRGKIISPDYYYDYENKLSLLSSMEYLSSNFKLRDDLEKEKQKLLRKELSSFIKLIITKNIEYLYGELNSIYNSNISNRKYIARGIRYNDESFGQLISEYADFSDNKKDYIKKGIGEWLKYLDIGFDCLEINELPDYQMAIIFLGKTGENQEIKWRQIYDLGFGISQIIAILLRISVTVENQSDDSLQDWVPSIMIIEEPETNLHPNLQSKLLDIIAEAAKAYHIRFIIETHSPYIIRRLQYHRLKNTLTEDDVEIYYFDPVDESNSKVKSIKITKDGLLDPNFGDGFLDEETQQKIHLMSLKTKNLN